MEYSQYTNNNNALEKQRLGDKIYSKIWLYILRGMCVVVLMGLCAVVGLGLGAFTGLLNGVEDFTDPSVLGIEGFITTIYDRNGVEVIQLSSAENREYVSIDEIPQVLKDAVVAIEDERFYTHNGIDLEGILRAGFTNLLSSDGISQGGSTLTQQVVKQQLLTTSQNWQRKIREWYLALQVEDVLSELYGKEQCKNMILELYLNYNFLGNTCYGVQTASNFYFNKDVQDLTLSEAALIAGLFQAPSAFDPTLSNNTASRNRQITVLQKMLELGFITQEEYDVAHDDNVFDRITANYKQYEETSDSRIWSYFVDSAVRSIVSDMQTELGISSSQAWNKLYYGGLSIHLTQDLVAQNVIDSVFATEYLFSGEGQLTWYQLVYDLTTYDAKDRSITTNYPTLVGLYRTKAEAENAATAFRLKYVNASATWGNEYIDNKVITIEPQYCFNLYDYHNGQVIAQIGGRGEKTSNLSTNRAADTARQPGSTFKLIAAYSNAIERGAGSGTVVDDSPFAYLDWAPTAWWGETGWTGQPGYYGLINIRKGIARSNNIAAARINTLYTEHGIDENFELALKFGFTTLRDGDENSDHVGSLCLGSCSVKNIELTAAYGAIANGGVRYDIIYYTKVLDNDGNILLEKAAKSWRVIEETTAWIDTDMLRGNVANEYGGTGYLFDFNRFGNSRINQIIAGKTGSSEDDSDLVFMGFTNYFVGGLWSGYDYYVYSNTSSNVMQPAHRAIWRYCMGGIHDALNLESKTSFGARPKDIVELNVCNRSGMLQASLCRADPVLGYYSVGPEYYVKGTEPTETCTCHCVVSVCSASYLYPSADCTNVISRVCIQRTPEQLQAIQDALEFFKARSTTYEDKNSIHAQHDALKAPETFRYYLIQDWPYMAPWCYNHVSIDRNTLSLVWTMGGANYQSVDVGLNEEDLFEEYDYSNPPSSSLTTLTLETHDSEGTAYGNIVIDTSVTHVCPICTLKKLLTEEPEPESEIDDSSEESSEESNEESEETSQGE